MSEIQSFVEIKEGFEADDLNPELEDLLISGTVVGSEDYLECNKKYVFDCNKDEGCTWKGGSKGCQPVNDDLDEKSNFDIVHALFLPLVSGMPEPALPTSSDSGIRSDSSNSIITTTTVSRDGTKTIARRRSRSKKSRSSVKTRPKSRSRSKKSRPRSLNKMKPVVLNKSRSRTRKTK